MAMGTLLAALIFRSMHMNDGQYHFSLETFTTQSKESGVMQRLPHRLNSCNE